MDADADRPGREGLPNVNDEVMNDVQESQAYLEESAHKGLDYWLAIRKRFWLIAAIVLIAVVAAYVKSSRTKPVYSATAKVLIERYNPQVIKVDEVMPDDIWSNDYYPTQYEILKSVSLAEYVIKTHQLHLHPEFNPEPKKSWVPFSVRSTLASVVRKVIPQEKAIPHQSALEMADDPLLPYVGMYLGKLSITPVRSSRLVNISFEGHDPQLVAKIANAHAEAYISKNTELKISATQDAVGWLGGRLDELKKSLQESKERLQEFVEKEDIVTLENILSSSGSSEENILTQKLAQLHSGLSVARNKRMSLETRYEQIKEATKDYDQIISVPEVVGNQIVQKVRADLIALKSHYSERLEKYGEKHPHMIGLRKEISNLQSRLDTEVARVVKSVKMQYEAAVAKERSLEQAVEQAKNEVQELNKKAIHYGMLKQEVESNREMYEMILKRAKETSLTSALKSTNISVVDSAKVPRVPERPRVRRTVMIGAAIALMFGMGLAVLLEYLDHTFHGPNEVHRYLGVPYLGSVGLVARSNGKNPSELVVLNEPYCSVVETIRTVRTNVLFSLNEPDQKAILVTSPGPLEGKTFITANLALTVAQMGRRVLLVDADMRKPRLHNLFDTSSQPGLSDLILGQSTLCEAVRDTQTKFLKLLPAGKIPPNPSEILGSSRMREFMDPLIEKFDLVIFDTPPVLSVTDGVMLAGNLDGTILVFKAGQTSRGNAKRALEHLQGIQSKILGVVLNQVNFKKDRYYYSYDTSYYYAGYARKRGRNPNEEQAAANS